MYTIRPSCTKRRRRRLAKFSSVSVTSPCWRPAYRRIHGLLKPYRIPYRPYSRLPTLRTWLMTNYWSDRPSVAAVTSRNMLGVASHRDTYTSALCLADKVAAMVLNPNLQKLTSSRFQQRNNVAFLRRFACDKINSGDSTWIQPAIACIVLKLKAYLKS